jgi:hypothetical protein
MTDQPITKQERQSLTVWGETFSAQIRPGGMALYIRPEAPRSTEEGRPFLLEHADVAKLRELLNEAGDRVTGPIMLHMRRDLRPWRLAYWRFRWGMRRQRRAFP